MTSLPWIYYAALLLGLALLAFTFWHLAKAALEGPSVEGCYHYGRWLYCRQCSKQQRRECPYRARH